MFLLRTRVVFTAPIRSWVQGYSSNSNCCFLFSRVTWKSGRRLFSSRRDDDRTYYQLLGVTVDSSRKDIKTRFYQLAKESHPDTTPRADKAKAQEEFARLTEAYETLSDDGKREMYDRERQLGKYAPSGSSFFKGVGGLFGGSDNGNQAPYDWGYREPREHESYRFDGVRPEHILRNFVHNAHRLEADVKKWIDWAFLDSVQSGTSFGSQSGRGNRTKQRHRRQARRHRDDATRSDFDEEREKEHRADEYEMWSQWRRMGGQRGPRQRRQRPQTHKIREEDFHYSDDLFASEWDDLTQSKAKHTGIYRRKNKHKLTKAERKAMKKKKKR